MRTQWCALHDCVVANAVSAPHHVPVFCVGRAGLQERVEKAGGQVLYWNGHRVMGVLAMSRAIGDHCLRPYVIPEPEVRGTSCSYRVCVGSPATSMATSSCCDVAWVGNNAQQALSFMPHTCCLLRVCVLTLF